MEQFFSFYDEPDVPTASTFDAIEDTTIFDPLVEGSTSEDGSSCVDKLNSQSSLDPFLVIEGGQQQLQQLQHIQASSAPRHQVFAEEEEEQQHEQQQHLPSPLEISAGKPKTIDRIFEDDDDIIDTVSLGSSASKDGLDEPLSHPSYSLSESLIAQKMSRLSMKERETIYYDIHGVSGAVDEEAEIGFLDRKLKEMELELQKILLRPDIIARIRSNTFCEDGGEEKSTTPSSSSRKTAYEMALDCNPSYAQDQDLRLRFLRAERFQADLAAERYMYYYESKLELFGVDKLGRDITQDDLDDEALDALYSGQSQILPQRDSAGRLVWVWLGGEQAQKYSLKSMLRRMFYVSMTATDDIETQRKGSVFVYSALNRKQKLKGSQAVQRVRKVMGFGRAMPILVFSIHFCYDNYSFIPIISLCQLSFHLFLQLRFRAHYGTYSECIYKLQTFGIPMETFPIDADGNADVDRHKQFFERRRAQEREWAKETLDKKQIQQQQKGGQQLSADSNSPSSSTAPSSTDKDKKQYEHKSRNNSNNKKCQRISVPSRCDVLLGRGKGYFNHVGNVRYRSLIDDLRHKYDSVPRAVKQKMLREVVATVHEFGGRFLKDDGGVWIEIDDMAACRKVGHSFRALREQGMMTENSDKMVLGGSAVFSKNDSGGPLRRPNNNKDAFVDYDLGNAVAPILKRMRRN